MRQGRKFASVSVQNSELRMKLAFTRQVSGFLWFDEAYPFAYKHDLYVDNNGRDVCHFLTEESVLLRLTTVRD